MKPFAVKFYNSTEWKECRAAYILSVQGLCETHLEHDEVIPGFIVHHKILLTPHNINNYEVSLNWDHLKYECKECHDKNEGHGVRKAGEVIREGLRFNDMGEVIEVG